MKRYDELFRKTGVYQVIHINLDIQLMCSQIVFEVQYKNVKRREQGKVFLREI